MPRTASSAPGHGWPFTGRTAELRAVTTAFARDGAVVVAGSAGLGKSRLARELVARVAPAETVEVVAASASSRDIPLGAFAPWLSGATGGSTDAGDDDVMVSALARVGAAVRAGGPRSVLLVDDAHALDTVSATLVHQLAQEHAVRLVLTVRSGAACSEAITAIWKDGLAERIELGSLDADDTAALLDGVLAAPVDAQVLRRLHDTTRGNVLWLRHLVEGERAAGRLVAVDGTWEWHGAPALSPALEQLLAERIGTLAEGERHALELVALGEPLGLSMLVDLVAEADVERIAERELITVSVDGARSEVRLAHPLYGEAIRARLSVPRARRLRGDLSRALRSTGGRRAGDELRRAVLDLGSDSPPDAALLILAAEQALNLTDIGLAERLLRAAVAAGGGFEARLGLGFLLGWMMRADEAERELAAALPEATTEAERARALLARCHLLMFILERPDEARAVLRSEGSDADGTPYPETVALEALLRLVDGDVVAGIDGATAALARPNPSTQTITWASWVAAYGTAYRGGGDRVRDHVARGMEAARAAPETIAMLGNVGFGDILEAGYSGALEDARPRLDWVDGLPGRHGATWSALYHGRHALESGRPATAVRLLESILPSFPGSGGGWTAWFHAMIAQGRAALGDAAGAAEALAAAGRARHSVMRLADPDVDLARAWVAAVHGSVQDAARTAHRAAAEARARGARAVEMVARHTAVRFGDRDQAGALAELARLLDGPRARTAAAHAAALAARDVAGLLGAAEGMESCGMLLSAADAFAHAAVVARDRGQHAEATAAADRAATLAAERCEGATTPALRLARAPLAVSTREREVATLAAEGLTNRQIASRLHVSVRTVESHIYRACTRLGLPDRAALAAAIAPHHHRGGGS
ncbi:LuxR C-terminal-related transcriptional regulator [Actinomycetospora sp. CA-101289]|uniref:LuxR C-terminal-related transcriptional regulator n=1 Tax=Actinomycetospora sp. CA-101289 TaxID=3239893 RepID=UPI003D95A1C4